MQFYIAEHAGFCSGVKRALKIAEESSHDSIKWYTLGPLVHNKSVIDYLNKKGVLTVDKIHDLFDGGIIIRSHGVSPDIINSIEDKSIPYKDATCPLVKKVHHILETLYKEDYQIVIYGDLEHPEVTGFLGWCDKQAIVIKNLTEAEKLKNYKKMALVAQTTKNEKDYWSIVEVLAKKTKELRSFNTICAASNKRQEAARKLADKVDLIIVIGDKSSSNTKTLFKECSSTGVKTYLVQDYTELDLKTVCQAEKIGITAGASTPDWIIKEVMEKMTENDGNALQNEQSQEINESKEVEKSLDEDKEVVESNPLEEDEEKEESFSNMEAEMAGFATPEKGDIIKGIVIQVADDEVMIDVGGKSEGVIPLRELSVRDINSAHEIVKVGDEIEVLVLKWDDDGNILLSKKKVDTQKNMDKIEEIYNAGEEVEGTIISSVKGGLLVDIGVVAFLPASHVEDGFVSDLEQYVNQTMMFKLIEFNRNKRRGSQVVVSRKELLTKEKGAMKEEFWKNIQEGQVLKGKVKRIVDYGAFIDLGGYEGLLHVSELVYARVKSPSEIISEGEEIEVLILALDMEKERVSLSRKKLLKSPWDQVNEKYQEGDIVDGKVVRIAQFGAFVEIIPGVDGLVHISQLADRRVNKVEDVIQVNEMIKAKILGIDNEKRRISLSIKEVHSDEEQKEIDNYIDQQENS